MTPAQVGMYTGEWKKAWAALRTASRTPLDETATRKRWHVLIGAVYRRGPEAGQPKKRTLLTNKEFDAFLKRCAATQDGGDLDRQLALDAMPERRALTACAPLLDELQMAEEARAAYVAGIYRNVQRPRVAKAERVFELHEMPDEDLQDVLIALTHTVAHKLGVDHNHPATPHASGRARYDHHVGARHSSAKATAPAPAPAPVQDELLFRPKDKKTSKTQSPF